MKRLICFLLGLLGFGVSGCEKVFDAPAEYGCPYINFRLSARVVDSEGNPIQGIRVIGDSGLFDVKTGYSDHLGNIDALSCSMHACPEILFFEDIDGELNGGDFTTLKVDVSNAATKYEEGEGWYLGGYEVALGDVVMTPKDDNDVEAVTLHSREL